MSLRIGVVAACPYPVPQGSQVYIEQTVRALHLAGHQAHLVCYGHGLGNPPADIPVVRCGRLPGDIRTAAGPSVVKPLLDLMLAHTISRGAKTHGWQALVAHNYEGLLAALASGVKPVVYVPHNALVDELPHYFGGAHWASKAGGWLDRLLPKRADAVVALHQRLADYLIACGCREDRVVVSPPAAPVDVFDGLPPEEDLPYVLYTGNLDQYQNPQLLCDAIQLLRQRLPEVYVVVATHDARSMEGAVTVKALGFNTVAELLQKDAILAAPRVSWSGYPIKLLNAMAAGRPSVACASAAAPLANGETGIVVPDDDAEAFAEALQSLLQNTSLRRRLGVNARQAAMQSHTLAHMAEGLNAALEHAGLR
jgi:glycosyltransferase involved in cell wall biosynthesis